MAHVTQAELTTAIIELARWEATVVSVNSPIQPSFVAEMARNKMYHAFDTSEHKDQLWGGTFANWIPRYVDLFIVSFTEWYYKMKFIDAITKTHRTIKAFEDTAEGKGPGTIARWHEIAETERHALRLLAVYTGYPELIDVALDADQLPLTYRLPYGFPEVDDDQKA